MNRTRVLLADDHEAMLDRVRRLLEEHFQVVAVSQKAFDYLDGPPQMVTPPHTPVPFSPVLEDSYIPTPEQVVDAVRGALD